MGLGMAKSKAKPVVVAKVAKSSAKVGKVTKVAAGATRKPAAKAAATKPAAKARPVAAGKKVVAKAAKAVKPVAKAAPAKKAAVKKAPVAKVVAKPPVAKKPAAKKPVAKPVATKPVAAKKPESKKVVTGKVEAVKKVEVKKPVPPARVAKPQVASRPAAVASAPPKPSTSKTEVPGKFVTKSKPDSDFTTSGARARATPPATPVDNGVTMQDGRYTLPATVTIDLPAGYKPGAGEEYMSPQQLQYFRNKLSKWRDDLVEESRQTIESLRDEVRDVGDEAERATRETENSLELRTRDRYRKLISKIDKAIKRIEDGHYGFCEETDEEIGIDRLEARPIATLSLDAQERWEHRQKLMGD